MLQVVISSYDTLSLFLSLSLFISRPLVFLAYLLDTWEIHGFGHLGNGPCATDRLHRVVTA